MANFPEEVLKEFKPILKRNTPTKEVRYRIRVVKRKIDGIFQPLLDIREYLITEKRFGFTESGIYLNRKELEHLEKCIKEAKEYFYGSVSAS